MEKILICSSKEISKNETSIIGMLFTLKHVIIKLIEISKTEKIITPLERKWFVISGDIMKVECIHHHKVCDLSNSSKSLWKKIIKSIPMIMWLQSQYMSSFKKFLPFKKAEWQRGRKRKPRRAGRDHVLCILQRAKTARTEQDQLRCLECQENLLD